MDLNEANRFKVYVLESLEGDMHTGQNLYDYLRQRSVDYTNYMFDAMYLSVYDRETLHKTLKMIAEEGSEAHISPTFLFNHGLSNRVIQIIRRTRDVVCQGRHIIIQ